MEPFIIKIQKGDNIISVEVRNNPSKVIKEFLADISREIINKDNDNKIILHYEDNIMTWEPGDNEFRGLLYAWKKHLLNTNQPYDPYSYLMACIQAYMTNPPFMNN